MTKEAIIQNTIKVLNILPQDKAAEISTFAEYVLKRYEEQSLQRGIEELQSDSDSFNFLHEDEELYSPADVKEKL